MKLMCESCGWNGASGDVFCAKCGKPLGERADSAPVDVAQWQRGNEDFAVRLNEKTLLGGGRGFDIRHGSKALFFEDGRLIEIADSGRYTTREGGLLSRLFGRRRNLSAVLVDGGDVVLPFQLDDIRTADKTFVSVSLEAIVRVEDHNRFYVNVMKNRDVFKSYELREMLAGELRNALQESVGRLSFDRLSANLQCKDELAVRLAHHLSTSFGRMGFGFGQVRALDFSHSVYDKTAHTSADARAEADAVRNKAMDEHQLGKAEKVLNEVERNRKLDKLEGAREDLTLKSGHQEVGRQSDYLDGLDALKRKQQDLELLNGRLEVYKKLREADVTKISTDEEFRKFQLEIDRDRLLDDAEWRVFKDEILWTHSDKVRDRNHLVRKIEAQQRFDERRLQLANDTALSLELRKLELVNIEREQDARHLLWDRENALAEKQAEAARQRQRADRLAEQETELELQRSRQEMRKTQLIRALEEEQDKALVRREIAELELELKQKKRDLGLATLDKMKAIKRADQFERELHQHKLELERAKLEMERENERHRQELERMREQAALERERLGALAGLNIEQLIAGTGGDRAKILGDLAQTQALRGLTSEEIIALRDPAALARALEERARHTKDEEALQEVRRLQDQLIYQMQKSMDQANTTSRENADRQERMFNRSLDAGNAQQGIAAAERGAADRAERMANSAFTHMGGSMGGNSGGVGGAGGGNSTPGSASHNGAAGNGNAVILCPHCRVQVAAGQKYCGDCGTRL